MFHILTLNPSANVSIFRQNFLSLRNSYNKIIFEYFFENKVLPPLDVTARIYA